MKTFHTDNGSEFLNWTAYTGPVNTNGATKTATFTAPLGNLFFRLFFPSP